VRNSIESIVSEFTSNHQNRVIDTTENRNFGYLNMTSNEIMLPYRVDEGHNFCVTPFGVYCGECNTPIGIVGCNIIDGPIRKHIQRKKHFIGDNLTVSKVIESLKQCMKYKYNNVRNFDSWILKKNESMILCSCGLTLSTKSNFNRHIRNTDRKISEKGSHIGENVSCVVTTCGRTIPVNILNNLMNKPCEIIVSDSTTTTSSITHTTGTSQRNQEFKNKYTPMQLNNNEWISTTVEDVRKEFANLKRTDEALDAYLPSLKLLLIHSNGSVLNQIERDINMMENKEGSCRHDNNISTNDDNYTLDLFCECMDNWVNTYCREHVNILDGRIRFQLQSFFEESAIANSGYNLNFNMREKEDVIYKELRLMVRFIWMIHRDNRTTHTLKSSLSEIIANIRNILIEHNGTDLKATMQKLIQKLLIQRFLHTVFIEGKDNAYSLLLGHRLIMTRLFFLKKGQIDTVNNNVLSIRDCGRFGSIVGLHIHIYRLGTASLIACTESSSWNQIISEINNSSLFHMLSPMIKKVKQMSNCKIDARTRYIDDDGNIIIDDFKFYRSKWSRLVGSLLKAFDATLENVFANDKHKKLVDLRNQIYVKKLKATHGVPRERLEHFEFYTNINGRVIRESDIMFKEDIDKKTFERLTGLVMICLHGLGLGSTRVSELFRIKPHQVFWQAGSIFYLSVSNKRGSSNMSKKKTVTHKLPPSISRYMLLYDYIGMQFSRGRDLFLFQANGEEIKSGYDNKEFYNDFSSIFQLGSNCTGLIMRHLYTSICNYIFPGDNNNFDKSIVSTVGSIAEMSGHSAETHEQFYSSSVNRESFFIKYHQALGEDITVEDDVRSQLPLATSSEVLHCLRVLTNVHAGFLSKMQQDMVLDACNNTGKHSFCSIGCGGGKSMAWIIPTIREHLKGLRPKMRIVILPYCFLIDHHMNSTKSLFGQCNCIDVEYLKGKDVQDNVVPNILRDKDSLPSILFLSLEATTLLLQHHLTHLEDLAKLELCQKIYIDECHTIFSEMNFRSKYLILGRLAVLNIPIICFSGSIQTHFIKDLLSFLFSVKEIGTYNLYIDKDIFGKKLMKIQHNASSDYINRSCKSIISFIDGNRDSNVHIISSTVGEGKALFQKLRDHSLTKNCELIFSGSEDQHIIAKKWSNSEIKILISTTLGLVGNECSNTQMVCIVGMMYNLPSIVQAIGRIRPMRRNDNSICSIFTQEKNHDKIALDKDEKANAFRELVACNILSDENSAMYFQSMTMQSVHNWLFNDTGCRYTSIARRLGYNIPSCKVCDKCSSKHILYSGTKKTQEISSHQIHKHHGIQLLLRLKQKCIVCNDTNCSGTCVVRNIKSKVVCFHCLGSHLSNQCKIYKPILDRKACYSCYVFNYDQRSYHDYRQCSKEGEIREKLRALIQHDFLNNVKKNCDNQQSNYQEHLSGIYASENTFFKFLYRYKDWK